MTPEDELCLLLARGRLIPKAEHRARQLLAGKLAWRRILDRIRLHEVLPLVCHNLKHLGFARVPDLIQAELAKLYTANALRNALLAEELSKILALLAGAQVPVMPLKGTPWAESLYGDAALRVCADIDILVPPMRLADAFHLLESSGYEARFTQPEFLKLTAHYGKDCLLMRQDRSCSYPLQLHCGLIWGGSAERRISEQIWSEAGRMNFHGVPAYALSAEWEFLYCAVHAARHGLFPLKWLVDLDQLCSHRAPDWADVKERAGLLGWEEAIQSSLCACATLLDTPVPAVFAVAPAAQVRFPGSVDSPLQIPKETLFSVRLLTSRRQKLGFLATRLFIPTPADCNWLHLPAWLFFVYYGFRPLRLICAVMGWLLQAGLSRLRSEAARTSRP